jgi:hypothetical protein
MRKQISFLAIAGLVLFTACKKTVEEFPAPPLSDYFPLTVGKYITYNLDSIVPANFGASLTTKSYQVKYVVDAQVTDANGKPAYRIIRYIRSYPAAPWVADNTSMAVPTDNGIEFVENNLRFIKLKAPITQDYTWKGNSYINTNSTSPYLKFYADWDYVYDSINMPAKIGTQTIENTIKVLEIDDQSTVDRTYSEAKYAKGIGLVYRNFLFWYNGTANGTYADYSYGVVLTMIDHN